MNVRECLLPQVEIERKKKEVKNKKKQFFLFWSYFFFSLGRDNPFFAIRERKSLNGERKEEVLVEFFFSFESNKSLLLAPV